MKQCPTCKTTYTDDTLRFCLSDGAVLLEDLTDAETVISAGGPLRIDIAGEAPRIPSLRSAQSVPQPVPEKKGINTALVTGIIAILVLVIVALGGFAAFIYFSDKQVANTAATPTPAPVNSFTPDRETAKLREDLANLQRQIDQQKNARTAANTKTVSSSTETTTVTADSPGDGFLALRSEPNSETGARLAKIPHGTAFTIGSCLDYKITPRGNRGRWCTANYSGQTGWVFDAFVKY
jgi:flagellar basal body-associated protein FliL